MKRLSISLTVVVLLFSSSGHAQLPPASVPAAAEQVWPSQPPSGCPFTRSKSIRGLAFTGRQASYTNADTWYPSWASDGAM